MIVYIYRLLRNHLKGLIPEVKHVDLFTTQIFGTGGDHVLATPSMYLHFLPIKWKQLSQGVQQATVQFDLYTVSSTVYGDERDLLESTYINHPALEDLAFKMLMNSRHYLSSLNEYSALEGTEDDQVIMESIVRISSRPHDQGRNVLITSQRFQGVVTDYTGKPDVQVITPDITTNTNYVE